MTIITIIMPAMIYFASMMMMMISNLAISMPSFMMMIMIDIT